MVATAASDTTPGRSCTPISDDCMSRAIRIGDQIRSERLTRRARVAGIPSAVTSSSPAIRTRPLRKTRLITMPATANGHRTPTWKYGIIQR